MVASGYVGRIMTISHFTCHSQLEHTTSRFTLPCMHKCHANIMHTYIYDMYHGVELISS